MLVSFVVLMIRGHGGPVQSSKSASCFCAESKQRVIGRNWLKNSISSGFEAMAWNKEGVGQPSKR
jgi:hypothetical protein